MPTVEERAAEIMDSWRADPELNDGCHTYTRCWFWALSLAYWERGNPIQATQCATMATAAALMPTRAYTRYGP